MERYKTIHENKILINPPLDEEGFKVYNKFTKKELIWLLLEAHKSSCKFYMSGSDTSGRCNNCGKQKWEH